MGANPDSPFGRHGPQAEWWKDMTRTKIASISACEAEYMLKQAIIGKVLSNVIKPIAQKTMGQVAHGWGWAGNKLGKGIGAMGSAESQAAHAAAGTTPWTQQLANKSQQLMDWGTRHMQAADKVMQGVGTQPGASGLQQWGGRALRFAGGATKYQNGWKGMAASMGSVPFLASWGYTPGSYAFDKALGAPGMVKDFVTDQRMRGAAQGAAQFADQDMLTRFGAAFNPNAIGDRLGQMDPRMQQYFNQYRQQ